MLSKPDMINSFGIKCLKLKNKSIIIINKMKITYLYSLVLAALLGSAAYAIECEGGEIERAFKS
jgi:hypothetical protein